MTHPRHQLLEITDIAQRLLTNWTRFAETSQDLAAGGDRLGIHGGDTPDPTLAGMYANAAVAEATSELAEALGHLRNIERRMATVLTQHPETARLLDAATRAARCSDPACTDNAVKNGLCWRCFLQHRTGGAA